MGVLRALVGGVWVDVPTALVGVQEGPRGPVGPIGPKGSEVFVGPDDPGTAYDIWIESDTQLSLTLPVTLGKGFIGQRIGLASSWTNATATATALTVTNGSQPTITFTAVANRYYMARWNAPVQSSVAGDLWETTIRVTGLSDEVGQIRIPAAATTMPTCWMERLFEASGSVTCNVLARRAAGTGTLSLAGVAADAPMHFWIEDVGGY